VELPPVVATLERRGRRGEGIGAAGLRAVCATARIAGCLARPRLHLGRNV